MLNLVLFLFNKVPLMPLSTPRGVQGFRGKIPENRPSPPLPPIGRGIGADRDAENLGKFGVNELYWNVCG